MNTGIFPKYPVLFLSHYLCTDFANLWFLNKNDNLTQIINQSIKIFLHPIGNVSKTSWVNQSLMI